MQLNYDLSGNVVPFLKHFHKQTTALEIINCACAMPFWLFTINNIAINGHKVIRDEESREAMTFKVNSRALESARLLED